MCSLLRGHPDPSPPHGLVRGQPPEGRRGPSPIQGLSTVTTVLALARHKDRWVTACLFPPTGGTTPTRREGGDVPGCPRSKLPCSAALKRLTPHLAVCEEVPRCGPARPNRRTHREPLQPGRRLRPVFDRHGRDGARQPTARPAIEAIGDPQGHGRARRGGAQPHQPQPGRRLRPIGGRARATTGTPSRGAATPQPGRRLRPVRDRARAASSTPSRGAATPQPRRSHTPVAAQPQISQAPRRGRPCGATRASSGARWR